MLLTKEQILNADDRQMEKVAVSEWGKDGFVFVKAMSGRARDKFENEFTKSDDALFPDIRAKLAALTVCDDQGKLMFDYKDVIKLTEKSSAPLSSIFDVAMRINKISEEDVKELEGK